MTRVPPVPADLSADSKNRWKLVHEGWVVDDAGRAVLTITLRAEDRAEQARKLIAREGIVKGSRAHPAMSVLKDATLIALKGWRQLGLQGAPAGAPGRPPGVV